VVVLGGGLSGVATAYALAEAGWKRITIVERAPYLGGLAGSFETLPLAALRRFTRRDALNRVGSAAPAGRAAIRRADDLSSAWP
jgi:uncharacterized protein with NAD-binding domain and iron-sulfur cluster